MLGNIFLFDTDHLCDCVYEGTILCCLNKALNFRALLSVSYQLWLIVGDFVFITIENGCVIIQIADAKLVL